MRTRERYVVHEAVVACRTHKDKGAVGNPDPDDPRHKEMDPPMPSKNSIRTASKLVVEVTYDDNLATESATVTLWVTTQQDRCISALSLTPDEAQKVGAMLAAAAVAVDA